MLAILIAAQVAQMQVAQPPVAQPPVAKVASPDAVARLQPMPNAVARPRSKAQTLSQGRALLARAEARRGADPELDARVAELKNDLDSLSEMGEMESLRLQMAMDRLSKLMSTISNLLKKASDTQNAIVQNLK